MRLCDFEANHLSLLSFLRVGAQYQIVNSAAARPTSDVETEVSWRERNLILTSSSTSQAYPTSITRPGVMAIVVSRTHIHLEPLYA